MIRLITLLMAAAGSLFHLTSGPILAQDTLVRLSGVVTDGPWRSEGYQRADQLRFFADPPHSTSFLITVSESGTTDVVAGDRITLKARTKRASILATQSELMETQCKGNSLLPNAIYRMRKALLHGLESSLHRRFAQLSAALLLGLKCKVPPAVKETFRNTGTAHLLAISGLHVSLIALGLVSLLTRLGLRERGFLGPLALMLFLFCLISGMRTPVSRACLVCLFHFSAARYDRAVDPVGVLFNACLVLLILDPHALFDLSFQLSFAGYGAILLFFRYRPRWIKKLGLLAGISFASWLGTLPLTLYYFHYFVPLAPLFNVVVFPFFTAALLCNALHLVALSLGLGRSLLTVWPAETSLRLLMNVLERLETFGMSPLAVEHFPCFLVIPWYLGLLLLMILPRRLRKV